jgi:hypothetical protein
VIVRVIRFVGRLGKDEVARAITDDANQSPPRHRGLALDGEHKRIVIASAALDSSEIGTAAAELPITVPGRLQALRTADFRWRRLGRSVEVWGLGEARGQMRPVLPQR